MTSLFNLFLINRKSRGERGWKFVVEKGFLGFSWDFFFSRAGKLTLLDKITLCRSLIFGFFSDFTLEATFLYGFFWLKKIDNTYIVSIYL